MVGQRKNFLLLLLVWFASFCAIWHLFCKYGLSDLYRDRVAMMEHVNESMFQDLSRKVSERDLRRRQAVAKTASENGMQMEDLMNESRDAFDVRKELQKIASRRRCKPVDKVLFLKTHKTASSTVTNILNRFADLRELVIALPAGGTNRFMWPNKFHWTSVDLLRLDGEMAHVLCNHARYSRLQMDIIMKKNTKYVTILRNPVTQFHSSFYYFEFDKKLGLQHNKDPLEDFFKDPDKHLYDLSIRLGDLPPDMNLIQNGMLYDLGYDFLEFGNETVVRKVVDTLARELDLVMLMEYFDESLVLLMREFCWGMDDILYIKMNQMKYKRQTLTEKVKGKIRAWNHADVVLYERFNRTFWQKVKRHGKGFWEDVKEFKRRNLEMFRICGPREIEEKGFKLNVTVKSLVLKSKVDRFHRFYCKKMVMNEIEYLQYFRTKLSPSFGYQRILKLDGIGPKKRKELSRLLKKRIKIGNKNRS